MRSANSGPRCGTCWRTESHTAWRRSRSRGNGTLPDNAGKYVMLTQTKRAAMTMDHLNFIDQSDNYPFKFVQSVAYLQYRTTSVRHEYQSGIPELWIMKHNRGGGL